MDKSVVIRRRQRTVSRLSSSSDPRKQKRAMRLKRLIRLQRRDSLNKVGVSAKSFAESLERLAVQMREANNSFANLQR